MIRNFISMRAASHIILLISIAAIFMHILIVLQVFPPDFIWGGRLQSREEVLVFESVSIIIQLFFVFIVSVKAGYLLRGKLQKTVNISLWILFVLMILNTVGNLFSTSGLEKVIMTPITSLLALLLFRLAIES